VWERHSLQGAAKGPHGGVSRLVGWESGTLARCPGCSRIPERRDGGSRIWTLVARNGRGCRNTNSKAAPFVYHSTQHRAHRHSTRRPGLAASSGSGGARGGGSRESRRCWRIESVEIPAFGGSERLGRWMDGMSQLREERREKQGVCFGRGAGRLAQPVRGMDSGGK
jgi:hypothetical protein